MKALTILLLTCTAVWAAETNRPPRPMLEIKGEFGRFNLKENIAYYSNEVLVVDPPSKPGDPPTTIRCRELTAKGAATGGGFETITASGEVRIDQGDKLARAGRAVYFGTNETMVLTEGFDAQHTRPYLVSGQVTNFGDVIVYDRVTDSLSISRVLTQIPGGALKTGTNATDKNRSPLPFGPK